MRGLIASGRQTIWLLGLTLVTGALQGATGQPISAAVITQSVRSVVQVQARNCTGTPVDASGFVWNQPTLVVTALHVVAGCRRVTVYSHATHSTSPATVARVLSEADLALLRLDAPLSVPALRSATAQPGVQTELVALGYSLAAPTPSSTTLRVSSGSGGRLREMLPDHARREVSSAGMPSLDVAVVRMEGHLVPGLSGAPLIDRQGNVAAVGDGGLENGAVSISWALPVHHLNRLMASGERVTQRSVQARPLFAAEIDARPATTVKQCGGMSFRRMRTRTYAQLASTTDDPMSEQYLRQLSQFAEVDPTQFSFDIYVNDGSGATVAVPEGLALEEWPDECTADFFNGALVLHVGGSTGQNVQAASEIFETNAVAGTQLNWIVDPSASYWAPQQRWDGLLVNRKGYVGTDPNDMAALFGAAQPVAALFETLAARGTAFMGVAAIHHHYSDLAPMNVATCLAYGMTPSCQRGAREIDAWIHMIMAAFLSSFPIG